MNIILIEARVEELLSKDQTGHGAATLDGEEFSCPK